MNDRSTRGHHAREITRAADDIEDLNDEDLDAIWGGVGVNRDALPYYGPRLHIQSQVYDPSTGRGAQWDLQNGTQPLQTIGPLDITPSGAQVNFNGAAPLTPMFGIGHDGAVTLAGRLQMPGANLELGISGNPIAALNQDVQFGTLQRQYLGGDMAGAQRTMEAMGITETTARDAMGLPRLGPSAHPVFQNPPGTPGAIAGDIMRARDDISTAQQQDAYAYMREHQITPADVSSAAATGSPITIPGGSNAIASWGPQQITGIVPSHGLSLTPQTPFSPGHAFLQPAPLGPYQVQDILNLSPDYRAAQETGRQLGAFTAQDQANQAAGYYGAFGEPPTGHGPGNMDQQLGAFNAQDQANRNDGYYGAFGEPPTGNGAGNMDQQLGSFAAQDQANRNDGYYGAFGEPPTGPAPSPPGSTPTGSTYDTTGGGDWGAQNYAADPGAQSYAADPGAQSYAADPGAQSYDTTGGGSEWSSYAADADAGAWTGGE